MLRNVMIGLSFALALSACETTEENPTPQEAGASDSHSDFDAGSDAVGEDSADAATDTVSADVENEAGLVVPEGYVLVSPAVFIMGSPEQEPGRADTETAHEVTLTRSFVMKKTEVTQGEWQSLMGYQPSYFEGCESCPVENVNWWEALAYCNALSEKEGLAPCYALEGCSEPGPDFLCDKVTTTGGGLLQCEGYRLPTEAEWEFAARAGTTTPLPQGSIEKDPSSCEVDDVLSDYGWYCGNSSDEPHPVGEKSPNAWNLSDMAGNVMEWVWDCLVPYGPEKVNDPIVNEGSGMRVLRGGSWSQAIGQCRSAARAGLDPAERDGDTGLRPVRSF
ncbi:MAG TPA: formylglycine-generating enzyme family protein [Polyangiaceae bacterium]|jgi:formylglycine-generating enzyme required for sulfatase activity|nr:MAG: Formylglycine-generating sulfatase enzyme [Deltaproteobacteria bacterium ADurb.Bin207]HNS96751.1 formylglycine-generating enzyme family protein [Polyangiaceae bacterium]HNZ20682.1 formylglycine-generating enzyme family protein [Polyangiaceae bacterium]HOD20702.1 formylglycine-generating enzyme family protein [Polyangiaceae bacterium]HOE47122.1 formylglycine-generating enzyme family protein [Polyangiaceae bacterium]